MNKLALAFLTLFILSNSAYAETKISKETQERVSKKINEKNMENLKRVTKQCFLMTGGSPTCKNDIYTPSFTEDENFKNWYVYEKQSEFEDTIDISLSVRSERNYFNKYEEEVTPLMTLECRENKTEVAIRWYTYLNNDTLDQRIRVDDKPDITQEWDVSTDYKAVFSQNPIELIKELSTAKSLLVEVTPYGDTPKVASFPIDGLEKLVPKLRQACNW